MDALSELLPLTVGMAISPLPIVAIVAIVLAPRGRASAAVYVATFTAVSFALLLLGAAGASRASSAAGTGKVTLILSALIAIGFAVFAVLSWRSRPRDGHPVKTPAWLAAIDAITPARALGLGLMMAAANSKNLPLALKGGAIIADAHLSIVLSVILCLGVAIGGSLPLIVPAAVALSRGPAVTRSLQRAKTEMIAYNAQMMTVVFAILAANEAAAVLRHLPL